MGEIYVVGLMLTAVLALLSIPILYLWAWAAGPAVKYLGRKWEEGRQRADWLHIRALHTEYWRGVDDAQAGRVPKLGPRAPVPVPDAPAKDEPGAQYTITGRRIR